TDYLVSLRARPAAPAGIAQTLRPPQQAGAPDHAGSHLLQGLRHPQCLRRRLRARLRRALPEPHRGPRARTVAPGSLLVRAALERIEQLLDNVDRDGKADADVAGDRPLDRVIDADHPALGVEQRAAGVSGVDGRVRLDQAGENGTLVAPIE